ncbi:hypothetical protein H0H93_000019 [Arthromyces matolae]|nr:hypothetical protein H0H93_000019 [Arthromyces matolae]
MQLQALPVELIADILAELDLESLIIISTLSRRLRGIVSEPALNPWRRPILCALRSSENYETLKTLSVRSTVPRQNWIEILSLASPAFILYEATLPNLKSEEWEECFNRRFLPSWRRWKKDGTWKRAYMKSVFCQSYALASHLPSDRNPMYLRRIMDKLVVTFADVRILAVGTLNRPRSTFTFNPNAHMFLHPPGIGPGCLNEASERYSVSSMSAVEIEDHGVYPINNSATPAYTYVPTPETYTRPVHPLPAPSHANYPYYSPGGGDKRWLGEGEIEEEGLRWVGGLMIIAQLVGPHTHDSTGDWLPLQDLDLVAGPGRNQYASFSWMDLWAIAPWMEERITRKIQGPGLGI